jgi:hypothetical protein
VLRDTVELLDFVTADALEIGDVSGDGIDDIVAITHVIQHNSQATCDEVEDLGLHFLFHFDWLQPGGFLHSLAQVE